MTGNKGPLRSHEDSTSREYIYHSSGQRVDTDIIVTEALRKQYPDLDLIVSPQGRLNLIAYASAGFATAVPLDDDANDKIYGSSLKWRSYLPPPRRLDHGAGAIVEQVFFGKFLYKWNDTEFLMYIANGRDGVASYPDITNHYILTRETHKVDQLIKEATLWGTQLHNEVWVFDQGWWQKSAELYNSVKKSNWDDVILEEGMKKAIIADVDNFFDGKATYDKLKVPWKRGIIYYGPPGNGKTISIKAMMHALYERGAKDNNLTVPTLYVRTLASFAGPEYSLHAIFQKAREEAPCYLVFEDLDSIVSDYVRSYFLNEVDGLKSNDGILMVGSTNHLDRLDPGISKRPSRFDRKYYFPNPDFEQRVAYAQFWQGKLKDNEEVKFPDELCPAIAKITDKFSFAYMQEAFIASLLAIARRQDNPEARRWAGPEAQEEEEERVHLLGGNDTDADLDDLVLWQEIQKQVKLLKEEMDKKKVEEPPQPPPHLHQPATQPGYQPVKSKAQRKSVRKVDWWLGQDLHDAVEAMEGKPYASSGLPPMPASVPFAPQHPPAPPLHEDPTRGKEALLRMYNDLMPSLQRAVFDEYQRGAWGMEASQHEDWGAHLRERAPDSEKIEAMERALGGRA
ncbi:P-loop containing nucleoside triphosphate hydrolase protein [Amniculicola lignicola CBS 123094]|uniref:P-loop containing nucleoside triphosphate hydrolase protein n=1 Tax=Amniculicola lignicola CBS 123094 TaxID=1392246 RepID=A0A6A5WNQ2_9PLEO|nr:P-loop containing nucleoside triphosphate hydrolase protein [Amniculicola lignicola CBS 123094]